MRKDNEKFNFKMQWFYCNGTCIADTKHPDQNKFEEVGKKDTAIYKH